MEMYLVKSRFDPIDHKSSLCYYGQWWGQVNTMCLSASSGGDNTQNLTLAGAQGAGDTHNVMSWYRGSNIVINHLSYPDV